MKKLLALIVVFAFASISASAAVVEFTIGDTQYNAEKDGYISGRIIEAPPVIVDGRTLVPVRAISDAFGIDIDWDETERKVELKNAEKEISLYIDSKTAYVNGEKIELDVAPSIQNGRTMVPLRFISEALSYNVNYVNTTKQVVIDDTPVSIACGDKKITLAEVKELCDIYKNTSNRPEGYTDEAFEDAILTTVLNNFYEIVLFSKSFPEVSIGALEKERIDAGIKNIKQYYTPQMKALNALVCEKYFFFNSSSIIDYIERNINLDELYQNEFVCAKHILVEDEKTANEVYEKAASGADFDALVKEYGKDPGMESNPTGYVFTKGEMVEEFEQASFALKDGEISRPVKSTYGYHIIKREALPQMTTLIKQSVAVKYGQAKIDAAPNVELKLAEDEIKALLK